MDSRGRVVGEAVELYADASTVAHAVFWSVAVVGGLVVAGLLAVGWVWVTRRYGQWREARAMELLVAEDALRQAFRGGPAGFVGEPYLAADARRRLLAELAARPVEERDR